MSAIDDVQLYSNFSKYDKSWHLNVYTKITYIIKEYYQYEITKRSPSLILKLIDKHWSSEDITLFETKFQYYLVLCSVSDNLITFLTDHFRGYKFENFIIFIEELYSCLHRADHQI
ncbi:hypothetical protein [Litchfieldia alkalitelluris]|uniref:hypothetical protein n=1 Tax=Litchfieldia alkalitelluris TaxID=304268 RepID=UPI0009965DE2|nr:hypothetical protein [Litchfieldia alkalitelluris]